MSPASTTPRQRKAAGGGSLEELIREVAVSLEGVRSTVESHSVRLDETRADAREARDAATKLTERLEGQNLPAQIAELKGEMSRGFDACRADLVNTSDKITREYRSGLEGLRAEHEGHDKRIKDLEGFRDKVSGAGSFVGWLSTKAPWLFAVLLAAAAGLGWKDKIGH